MEARFCGTTELRSCGPPVWRIGRYISEPPAFSNASWRTSATTPMTVRPPSVMTICPSGSWPGHNVRARVSLIITTGSLDARSLSVQFVSPDRNGNSCRLEIPVAHNANEWLRRMVALPVNLPASGNTPRSVVAQRQDVRNPRRHNPRDRASPVQHIVDKGVLLGGTHNPETRIDSQRGRSLRLKSQIHVEDPDKAANQQARADEQDAGERDLGNHQPVAYPRMPRATAGAARSAAAAIL